MSRKLFSIKLLPLLALALLQPQRSVMRGLPAAAPTAPTTSAAVRDWSQRCPQLPRAQRPARCGSILVVVVPERGRLA